MLRIIVKKRTFSHLAVVLSKQEHQKSEQKRTGNKDGKTFQHMNFLSFYAEYEFENEDIYMCAREREREKEGDEVK